MSWEELRFKKEANGRVKGRFCGWMEVMLIHLDCSSESVRKVSESRVGKCQAEMETWTAVLPVPGMVLLLQGQGGDKTCTQSWPWQ